LKGGGVLVPRVVIEELVGYAAQAVCPGPGTVVLVLLDEQAGRQVSVPMGAKEALQLVVSLGEAQEAAQTAEQAQEKAMRSTPTPAADDETNSAQEVHPRAAELAQAVAGAQADAAAARRCRGCGERADDDGRFVACTKRGLPREVAAERGCLAARGQLEA
jgi:hypothetical protein